ncbi:MAG TPA: thiamine diphosphokinase [Bacteroidota bacterium]|nr:thiamine diphosphokinase [Bacteroidota bacterium]
MNKRIIILANGTAPARRLLQSYLRPDDILICADGGANTAAKLSVTPKLILGDLDSVSPRTLKKFKNVPQKQIREQNSTDLEKALSYAVAHHYTEALVFGATGGRADHEFSNFSALSKFSDSLDIIFIDRYGEYISLENETVIHLPIGTTISLLPLTLCKGVTTSGLKWNLTNELLGLGVRESTRNVSMAESVSIKFRTGKMIVFLARSINKSPITKSKIKVSQIENQKIKK